jgi:lysophospholipase L1-like esterase
MRALTRSRAALVAGVVLATAAPAQADWRTAPVVPPRDSAAATRATKRAPSGRGVFAKAGDSISWIESFMQGFGCGPLKLGGHSNLRRTVDFFRERRLPSGSAPGLCKRNNSFSRMSVATRSGTTAEWATRGGFSPLDRELRQVRPAWLLVMFGTNDAAAGHPPSQFRAAMTAIIKKAQSQGTVPILYTVPPRLDNPVWNAHVERYNRVLYRLARSRHLPLINLWRALRRVPFYGLQWDGIHLNDPHVVYSPWEAAHAAADLDQTSYGANVRNLITLRTLQRVVSR